jgi:enamine deaminase RidA (YjgF/YER057c/UK114 family)
MRISDFNASGAEYKYKHNHVPEQSIGEFTNSDTITKIYNNPVSGLYSLLGQPSTMMSSKSLPQTFNPPGVAPPTKPTFSHASVFPLGTAKVVTIAGQIGTFPGGSIPPDSPSQVSNDLRNVKTCLTAAGAAPSNIMSNTHYVVNYDPTDTTRNALFVEFLDGYRPPGTLVPVEMLAAPQLLFAIDVMAVVEVD